MKYSFIELESSFYAKRNHTGFTESLEMLLINTIGGYKGHLQTSQMQEIV